MFFKNRIYVVLFCFVFALAATAQGKDNAISLKKILILIENQHRVSFNYTENTIERINIIPPKKSLSLVEKIKYLEQKTALSFENIDNFYFNIYKEDQSISKMICGYVFSKSDQLPLYNANITLDNGKNTMTNKDGYFEFRKENQKYIRISFIGFNSKNILLSDFVGKNCLSILMDPEIIELQEINTNPFLTSGISKKINGTFEIKPKKFGILPGLIEPDVLQTMQQIPGINSTDESVASINVRGGTHDQNLFLWNGIKMYQTGHFFGLISAFNPNLAHTISISKNGTSAFYGESVSSVIAISSDQNQSSKNSFSGGINMINADFYSKFNLSKRSFLEIATRKSITDYIATPTYTEYFNKAFQNTSIINYASNQNIAYSSDEKFNFYDITLKYSQKIGLKNHLILDLITINDELKVQQSRTINAVNETENNVLNQKNRGGNFSFKRNWNSKNKSQINAYTSFYQLNAEKNTSNENQLVKQENSVLDTGIKIEHYYNPNSKISFNSGYQFNEIGATNLDEVNSPLFYRKNKEVIRTHAAIAEGIYNDSLSRIYLNLGFRMNYIEDFKKLLLEPRLQLNYGITKNFRLEVLGEFKSQNCFQIIDLQKDYFGVEKRRWILSNNAAIPIQRSKQISLNLSYTKDNWLFSIENYYKKVSGINSSSQGFQNQLEFEKINGDYEVIGTEILLQKKIQNFITWLSYTYNDNNYYFPNFVNPVFSNNFEMDNVVVWAGIYEKDNLKIALGSKWYSGRPETTPINTVLSSSNPQINYNPPNNKHLDSFFQMDFSTTYKWNNSKGIQYRLGISVLNILDRKNEISEYYRINSITNSIEDIKTFALRRTPNMSLRVAF